MNMLKNAVLPAVLAATMAVSTGAEAKPKKAVQKPAEVMSIWAQVKGAFEAIIEKGQIVYCNIEREALDRKGMALRYDIALRVHPELFDFHEVKEGDSVESIAKEFGLDNFGLGQLEQMYWGKVLVPGKTISVPKEGSHNAIEDLLYLHSPTESPVSRMNADRSDAEYFDKGAEKCVSEPTPDEVAVCMKEYVQLVVTDDYVMGCEEEGKGACAAEAKYNREMAAKLAKERGNLEVCSGVRAEDLKAVAALEKLRAALTKY